MMATAGKCIYVPVSDETHDLLVFAVEQSPLEFEDWVLATCLEAARAEIDAAAKANRAAMGPTHRRRPRTRIGPAWEATP